MKLLPGRYYLTATYTALGMLFTEGEGKPEMRIGPVTLDSPLELRAGQELSGVDFKLPARAAYHVRGAIVPPGHPSGNFPLFLRSRNHDRPDNTAGGLIEKDGSFDIPGVLPGSYWLEFPPYRGFQIAAKFPVDVTDRDVNGVKIATTAYFTLRGHVRFEDGDAKIPLSSVKVNLVQLDWGMFPSPGQVSPDADGNFQSGGLQCAEYVPRLATEGDLYLKSVTMGGRPLEGGRIDLRNGPQGELEMILGTGTGEVTGTVRPPEARGHAILVSPDGPTANTGARGVEIDGNGQFRFRFVPPGRWLVFVAPAYDEDRWQNAEFVKENASDGVAIELDKRGSARVEVAPMTVKP